MTSLHSKMVEKDTYTVIESCNDSLADPIRCYRLKAPTLTRLSLLCRNGKTLHCGNDPAKRLISEKSEASKVDAGDCHNQHTSDNEDLRISSARELYK